MKVLVIGDVHFPFHSKKALAKVFNLIKIEKPDAVVQIGDLLDQYIFSKYNKTPKITPDQDVVKGLAQAKQMWKDIAKIVPKARLYQILGNHDIRISKRISELLPALSSIYSPLSLYNFPGVKVMKSDRHYLKLDGVVYCHGWLSKSIDHAKHFSQPTVHGHRHQPTVQTDGNLWSMDVGYMADDKTLPLSYTASKFTRWRKACGVVENGLPHLILL